MSIQKITSQNGIIAGSMVSNTKNAESNKPNKFNNVQNKTGGPGINEQKLIFGGFSGLAFGVLDLRVARGALIPKEVVPKSATSMLVKGRPFGIPISAQYFGKYFATAFSKQVVGNNPENKTEDFNIKLKQGLMMTIINNSISQITDRGVVKTVVDAHRLPVPSQSATQLIPTAIFLKRDLFLYGGQALAEGLNGPSFYLSQAAIIGLTTTLHLAGSIAAADKPIIENITNIVREPRFGEILFLRTTRVGLTFALVAGPYGFLNKCGVSEETLKNIGIRKD